jgi:hypothetical protein
LTNIEEKTDEYLTDLTVYTTIDEVINTLKFQYYCFIAFIYGFLTKMNLRLCFAASAD